MKVHELKNMNDLAKYVALKECGKKQVSIAQIKEILKVIADGGPHVNELLWRYTKRRLKLKPGI